ncbi:anti-sigma factor [Sutcliffiella sp. NC1]|uniref:anti-sigma factor n=1 Tax=Sutcliffiella sp. NC1 TaxID=3004096 RepID=UPI0022DDF6A6|nr:anti-sigma factor [Sutcliffiella sp. NC1]WBL16907.1 anti sigma factor C-terminal domain-containing protein [Sutcliffiella sp. NC1]
MKEKDKNHSNDENLYEQMLNNSIDEFDQKYSPKQQQTIVKRSKNKAMFTNILISLAILLLIVPVMTLLTYFYYSSGENYGRANNAIEVASKLIYVTEPNMSVEEMEIEEEIGFFTMDLYFDVYKRIGSQDYNVGDYEINYYFDKPNFPKRNLLLDRPLEEIPQPQSELIVHPDVLVSTNSDWNILKGLPDGTVSEMYVSFSETIDVPEVNELFNGDMEVRWLAVDTGLERKRIDKDGYPLTPLGYPAQVDTTTWSPFNGREQTNEEVFLNILKFLKENEETATILARAKSLSLEERIKYIEENGIKIYGVVVTGPTAELRNLQENEKIKSMKIGEVKLWNWK